MFFFFTVLVVKRLGNGNRMALSSKKGEWGREKEHETKGGEKGKRKRKSRQENAPSSALSSCVILSLLSKNLLQKG
jgi:hypothetical protein